MMSEIVGYEMRVERGREVSLVAHRCRGRCSGLKIDVTVNIWYQSQGVCRGGVYVGQHWQKLN